MSERTGLGTLEEAIVLTLEGFNARHDRPHKKCELVLAEVESKAGFGPRYSYEALCDLAAQWVVLLPLVDGQGNLGHPDGPAAEARYTKCRLSPAGTLAAAAERGHMAPLPFGLINGTQYRGGRQPSFAPSGVVAALTTLVQTPEVSDDELLRVIGSPMYPTGCGVDGQLDHLVKGRAAILRLSAVITVGEEQDRVVFDISNLPPEVGPSEVCKRIASRLAGSGDDDLAKRTNIALGGMENLSTQSEAKIRCWLAKGADPDVAKQRLMDVWGMTTEVTAELPAPLADLLRSWVRQHAVGNATSAALSMVESCFGRE